MTERRSQDVIVIIDKRSKRQASVLSCSKRT
jgi:hypothetical protein